MEKKDLQYNVDAGYARGWSFTPLAMVGASAGKRPLLSGWQAAAHETLEQALAWAASGNVGLRTGAASGGLLVIDLDAAKPEYREDLVKALHLPITVTAKTGGGGFHLYFKLPAGLSLGNSSGKLAPAVDTRGDGGQVVYPGSVHLGTGKPYAWMDGRDPGSVAVADLPANVLEILRAIVAQPPSAVQGDGKTQSGAAVSQRATREHKYGKRALADEMSKVSSAAQGTRNSTLNESALRLGSLVAGKVLDRTSVESGLLGAALACGLPRGEAEATIKSGLDAGAKEPRGLPPPTRHAPACQPPADDRGTPPDTAEGGGATKDDDVYNGRPGDPIPLGLRDPESRRLVLSAKRVLPTALAYCRQFATHWGKGELGIDVPARTMYCFAGRMLTWRNNRYAESEDGAVRHRLQPWLHEAMAYNSDGDLLPFPANPATVESALTAIKSECHLPADTEVPSWLDKTPNRPPPLEVLACRSKLLHIPGVIADDPKGVMPGNPAFFTLNAMEFDFDRNAPVPENWLKFLAELWPSDPESVELLQEWFGYCLTPDTSQQKMLLILGPRRCGKGTIGRILSELVGLGNVVGPTTDSLAETFGMQQLIGKSVAVVADARFVGNGMQCLVERLLTISGEDRVTTNRKNQDHLSLRLSTRFLFLTNPLPKFSDAAGALAGRFLILNLRKSFFGREDIALEGKLRKELPGILIWALQGWERLHARGRFAMPKSSRETETLLYDLSSPVSEFVREACDLGEGDEFRAWVDDLYAAWKAWAEAEGRGRPGTRQGFGRDLAAAFPQIRVRRNSAKGRFYDGIAIKGQNVSPASEGQQEPPAVNGPPAALLPSQ